MGAFRQKFRAGEFNPAMRTPKGGGHRFDFEDAAFGHGAQAGGLEGKLQGFRDYAAELSHTQAQTMDARGAAGARLLFGRNHSPLHDANFMHNNSRS
jgi:hypothetical protein